MKTSPNRYKVIVVEDNDALRGTVAKALERADFEVRQAIDGIEGFEKIQTERADLVLMDVNMPRLNGLDCLKAIKDFDPSIIVIVMTAYSTIEDAVRAIKEGAYNYLAKPIKHPSIVEMCRRALEAQLMVKDMAFSAPVVQMPDSLEANQFVGSSTEMRKLFNIIYKLSKVDTSVLIRGESGTGKELVSRAIHYNSVRKDQKLVAINCSAIAETLFESELFGHERGAFTGADQRKIGKFQYAEGGTLFLDEIGDLSPAMQVKLLRVLQERKFTPVGSNREIEMDVRIIAATNRNLEEMIKQGIFREDLFYRLNVIPIFLPPLRERKGDLENLAKHFIAKLSPLHKKTVSGIAPSALNLLLEYDFPGNIRELENVIEHALVIEGSSTITVQSLPANVQNALPTTGKNSNNSNQEPAPQEVSLDYHSFKEQVEKEFIIRALKAFNGKINQTALHAKIPKKTLLRKLQKYGIRAEDYRT